MRSRQRIGKHQAADPFTRTFRGRCHHHAAGRSAHQHRIAQIMEMEIFSYFLAMAFGINAGAHLMAPFSTAIQGWCMHVMACGAEPFGDKTPNPAALIGPVDQNNARHVVPSVLRRS